MNVSQVMQEMHSNQINGPPSFSSRSALSPRSQHHGVIGFKNKPRHQRRPAVAMASLQEVLYDGSKEGLVGFVGAGNMAWAIFQNILSTGIKQINYVKKKQPHIKNHPTPISTIFIYVGSRE